jgi:sec-independent protein translocase protein TatA
MVLFLSDVSGSEILLIFVFVLIFFGAKSIPNLAKTLGKTIHQIKNASDEIKTEIRKTGLDMKSDMNLTSFVEETVQEIATPITSEVNQVADAANAPIGSQSYRPSTFNEEVIENEVTEELNQKENTTEKQEEN